MCRNAYEIHQRTWTSNCTNFITRLELKTHRKKPRRGKGALQLDNQNISFLNRIKIKRLKTALENSAQCRTSAASENVKTCVEKIIGGLRRATYFQHKRWRVEHFSGKWTKGGKTVECIHWPRSEKKNDWEQNSLRLKTHLRQWKYPESLSEEMEKGLPKHFSRNILIYLCRDF